MNENVIPRSGVAFQAVGTLVVALSPILVLGQSQSRCVDDETSCEIASFISREVSLSDLPRWGCSLVKHTLCADVVKLIFVCPAKLGTLDGKQLKVEPSFKSVSLEIDGVDKNVNMARYGMKYFACSVLCARAFRNLRLKVYYEGPGACDTLLLRAKLRDICDIAESGSDAEERTAISVVKCKKHASFVSTEVAVVCGEDSATAHSYNARSDALKAIALRHDLWDEDYDALAEYAYYGKSGLCEGQETALRISVLEFLCEQQRSSCDGLAISLVVRISLGKDSPLFINCCIRQLRKIQNKVESKYVGSQIRDALFKVLRLRKNQPYAGIALRTLGENKRVVSKQSRRLKRITLAMCKPDIDMVNRIEAIQIAGERNYVEVRPVLKEVLSSPPRNVALDTACIRALGFVGKMDDISLLERFMKGDARLATAAETAIQKIRKRGGLPTLRGLVPLVE